MADNRTDQEFVARVTGKVPTHAWSGPVVEWRQDLAVVPPRARIAFETIGFGGDFSIWTIEFLASDCSIIATFDQGRHVSFTSDGTLFMIDPGPSVTLRREWPASADATAATDRCGKLPEGS